MELNASIEYQTNDNIVRLQQSSQCSFEMKVHENNIVADNVAENDMVTIWFLKRPRLSIVLLPITYLLFLCLKRKAFMALVLCRHQLLSCSVTVFF